MAKALGVSIALETHDRFSSAVLVAEVLKDLPSAAAALWDVGHPYRLGDGPEKVLALLSARIAHVHIKDCRRKPGSTDLHLTLLAEGEVPFESCLVPLLTADYSG